MQTMLGWGWNEISSQYCTCFQEWVTDSPFIISPRITFEVSVRLLGGLMALGYTIAAILKRTSHCFFDDKVCIKTDWLEQLNRRYVQVMVPFFIYLYWFTVSCTSCPLFITMSISCWGRTVLESSGYCCLWLFNW